MAEKKTLEFHGIRFTLSPDLEVTDSVREKLEQAARKRLEDPVAAFKPLRAVHYRYAAPRETVGVPDGNVMDIETNGIRGPVLRIGHNGKPAPGEDEIDPAAVRSYRTQSAYVAPWSEYDPDGGHDPDDIVVDFD